MGKAAKRDRRAKRAKEGRPPQAPDSDLASRFHAFFWDLPEEPSHPGGGAAESESPEGEEPPGPAPLSQRDRDEILLFGGPLRPSIFDEMAGGEFDDERFIEEMTAPLGPPSPRMVAEAQAKQTMWALLALSEPGAREAAIQEPPYRDLLVAQALLDESEVCAKKPMLAERSRETALLAAEIARLLDPKLHLAARVLEAQALCLEANADRIELLHEEAEERLGRARALIGGLPRSAMHAFYLRHLGALREDQGCLVEATVLLKEAASLFRQRGDGRRAMACEIDLGFLYLRRNQPGPAMILFTRVYERIPSLLVALLAKVRLGQAICLAAGGLHEEARQVIERSLRLRENLRPRDRVKIEWLICRIEIQLGDFEAAIPRLEAVCRWLASAMDLTRLSLCSIDLAHAYARAGNLAEKMPAIEREIERSPNLAESPWALGALRSFYAAVTAGRDPAAAAREAATLLPRPRFG